MLKSTKKYLKIFKIPPLQNSHGQQKQISLQIVLSIYREKYR